MAAETPTPTHYIYLGQRIDLELDPSRLAIRSQTELAAETCLEAAAEAGVDAVAATPTGVSRWFMLDLRQSMADAADTAARIALLGASPQIEFTSPVYFGDHGDWWIVTPDILLRFEPEYASQADVLLGDLAPELQLVTTDFGKMTGAYQMHSPSASGFEVLATANRLAGDHRIAWAEPDAQYQARRDFIPDDPYFPQLWGIRNTGQSGGMPDMDMDGDEAWDVTTGNPAIGVLIMDDGVDMTHPDLNQLPGQDFTGEAGGGGPVNMCDTHGTMVASCVSAIINNGLGVVGISPDCPIRSARVYISNVPCDGAGVGQNGWKVNALAWAEENGVRSTNLSWSSSSSSGLATKYAETRDGGMVHFHSSGNGGAQSIGFPGSLDEVHSVGALNRYGNRASFSNYGANLSFIAPGQQIYVARVGGSYSQVDGTSFASPYAAGVAALVISVVPAMTGVEIDQRLIDTCVDLGAAGFDIYHGWGLLNAAAAIDIPFYYALEMALTSLPTQIGGASEIVSYSGELTNTGITDDVYDVTMTGIPSGWTYSYTTPAGTFSGPSSLPLTAGSTATIEIDIDSQGSQGTVWMGVSAVSQGDPLKSATFQFQKINHAQVLLVDDDGGEAREPQVESALDVAGVIWGRWDLEWGELTQADLETAATAVVWLAGDAIPSLTENDRTAVAGFMDGGGKVLLTGQEIGFDLADPLSPNYSQASWLWLFNYAHALYQTTHSTSQYLSGVAGDPIGDGLSFGLLGAGPVAQTSPDVINPGNGSDLILTYDNTPNWGGGVKWTDGSTHLVYLAFGLEGIYEQDEREELTARILTWFGIESTGLSGVTGAAPGRFHLAQNSPNPFNPSTVIDFTVPAAGPVELRVFDVSGRLVRTLLAGPLEAGRYSTTWDGRSELDVPVATGIYYYRIAAGDHVQTRKMVLLK